MMICHSPKGDKVVWWFTASSYQSGGLRTHLDTAYIPAFGEHIRTLGLQEGGKGPTSVAVQIMTTENWAEISLKTKRDEQEKKKLKRTRGADWLVLQLRLVKHFVSVKFLIHHRGTLAVTILSCF